MKKESIYFGKGMKRLRQFLVKHYQNSGDKCQSQENLKAIVSLCKRDMTELIKSSSELFILMYHKNMFVFFLEGLHKSIPREKALLDFLKPSKPLFKILRDPNFNWESSKGKKLIRDLESASERARLEASIEAAFSELQSDLEAQCKKMARNFVSDLREIPLDERVEYSWKYLFIDMLRLENPVESPADLKFAENLLTYEEWAFRNFIKEIEDNFLGLNSDAAKEYIEELSILMEAVGEILINVDFPTPPKSSPFWLAKCKINQRRKEQRGGFFRELEQQFDELQELQKKFRFTCDLRDCMPKTTREKIILMWEMGELEEGDLLSVEATLTETEREDLRRLVRILENPDLWGTAEYEAVHRMRDIKRRKALYKRKPVNLLSYNQLLSQPLAGGLRIPS